MDNVVLNISDTDKQERYAKECVVQKWDILYTVESR